MPNNPTFDDMQTNMTGDGGFSEFDFPYATDGDGSLMYNWAGYSLASERATRVKSQAETMTIIRRAPAIFYIIDVHTSNIVAMTNKFWLTTAQETQQEKAQIMETFGSQVAYFFGTKTKIYSFAGAMLETKSFAKEREHKYFWTSSFLDLYNSMGKASQLAKNHHRAVLTYQNNALYGYPLNLNITRDANNPQATGFSFSMMIVKHDLFEKNVLKDLYQVPETKNTLADRKKLSAYRHKQSNLLADKALGIKEMEKYNASTNTPDPERRQELKLALDAIEDQLKKVQIEIDKLKAKVESDYIERDRIARLDS